MVVSLWRIVRVGRSRFPKVLERFKQVADAPLPGRPRHKNTKASYAGLRDEDRICA